MTYRFTLVCPSCNRTCEHVSEKRAPSPQLNCGDCLMDRAETVEFKVVKVEEVRAAQ